jgi:3-deoxy-D-manno-octulosonate 8-phosphate phosphatase (KDO 8-P phosphatase)
MSEEQCEKRSLKNIRALVMDVDGVLTDGGFWWGAGGEELKRFCFADVMGLSLARRAGIELALISGENSPLIDRYAEKMLIRHVVKGCRDKATALRGFSLAVGIELAEICFMGDDINDLPATEIAGYCAAPSNAMRDVIARADFVAKSSGGNGAVREVVDALFAAKGIDARAVLSGNRN